VSNTIKSSQCTLWVHKRCSSIQDRIVANPNYVWRKCRGQAPLIDGRIVTQVDVDGTLLDVETSFCYLGDMLSAGGGCSLVILTRCCNALGKFKKLLPILTSKHISLTVRGKVFDAWVRSVLLHGSKTWAPTAPDLQPLWQNDKSMIRWICGVKPHDEISIDLLCARLGIQEVTAALSVLDGMDMSSDLYPVSSLSPIWRFYI